MSKVTLLAAPITEPSMDSIHRHHSEFGNVVRPTLEFTQRSQKLVTSIALFVILRISHLLNGFLLLSIFVARHFFRVVMFSFEKSVVYSRWLLRNMMESKGAKRTWRKFEMELTALFFGPVGNGIVLLLFWPGWIVIFLLWALWRIVG